MTRSPKAFITHTCCVAGGRAAGSQSYYLRGGPSSWQLLQFMNLNIYCFCGCDTGQRALWYQQPTDVLWGKMIQQDCFSKPFFFPFQITVKIGTRVFFLRLNKTAREELIGHIFYFLSVERVVRWAIFLRNYGDPGMRSAVRCCPFVHDDVQLSYRCVCIHVCSKANVSLVKVQLFN